MVKIKKIVIELFKTITNKENSMLPEYIAFYILLSFIPFFTVIFQLISLISINNEEILLSMQNIVPSIVFSIINHFIVDNSHNIKLFTVSNIILLFLSSRIYFAFYQSYLTIYKLKKKEKFFKDRVIALINTILIIMLIILLTMFTVLSKYVYQIIELRFIGSFYLYNYLNIIFSILVITSIVTFMMYSIPNVKQKVKDVYLGALTTTIGWLIVSYGFKLYVENYANYQSIYKTFATTLIFILWIYLLSYVLIFGIMVNKVVTNITRH